MNTTHRKNTAEGGTFSMSYREWFTRSLVCMALLGLFAAGNAQAADASWKLQSAGNWNNTANWNPAVVPGGAGSKVSILTDVTAARTKLTIDVTPCIVGTLNIGDSNTSASWNLTNSTSETLTFDGGSGVNATLIERTTSRADLISLPILLNTSLNITNASAYTLTLSGGISANSADVKTISNLGTGSGDVIMSGSISDGAGSVELIQNSASSGLTLSGANAFTGPITISAGTLSIGSAGNLGNGTFAGDITNNGALVYGGTATQTFSGVISGSGTLTQEAGVLLISNVNTCSGMVTVNGGTLGGTGTIAGPVTVGPAGFNGAVLAPSLGAGGSDTLTLSSAAANALTLNSGLNLKFALSSAGTSDQINITGGLVLNGGNYITLTCPGGGTIPPGTYTLMTYTSKSGSGTLALNGSIPNATLNVNSTSVTLVVGAGGIPSTSLAGSALTWKGNVSGNWDIGGTANWTNMAGSALAYTDGNAVRFDQNAIAGRFSVTSTVAVVSPGSVTISNTTAYTIGANIGGDGYLLKQLAGTATLTGTNTYTGPTMITGGTLTIGGAGQLGGGNYAGVITHNGTLLKFDSSAPNTLSGGITGIGTVSKSGSGDLTISGVNSIGALRSSGGGIILTNASLVTTTVTAGGNVIGSGGTEVEYLLIAGTNGPNNHTTWNASGSEIYLSGSDAANKYIMVSAGGVLTNFSLTMDGNETCGPNNGLIITNGGQVFVGVGTWLIMGKSSNSKSNYVYVGGTDDSGNNALLQSPSGMSLGCITGTSGNDGHWMKVDRGGVVTISPGQVISIGSSSGACQGNNLVVANGGKVYSGGNVASGASASGKTNNWAQITGSGSLWILGGDLKVGTGTTSSSNYVSVTDGGLLEGTGFTVGNASSIGNTVTVNGGILQFTTKTPAITIGNSAQNGIVITDATISYKGLDVANRVNLTNNWGNSGIGTNGVVWNGTNTLRLDSSAATNSLGGPYVFDTNLGSTNYVNLELLGNSTIYGKGITIGTNGSMRLSDAVATISGGVTNFGSIAGSGMVSGLVTMASGSFLSPAGTGTMAFSTNLTFTGTGTLKYNYNASAGSLVTVGGTLTLPATMNLTVIGSGELPANTAFFTWPTGTTAPSTTWNVSPAKYAVKATSTGYVLTKRAGTLIKFY
jgi:fibronectin-binding autotransporter adhesin